MNSTKNLVQESTGKRNWDKQLCTAVKEGDMTTLTSILSQEEVKRDGDLGRSEWPSWFSPLHLAVIYDRPEAVDLLLETGVKVDCGMSIRNDTALNHVDPPPPNVPEVRRYLEELAARSGYVSATTTPPMNWARRMGLGRIIRILEDHRAAKEEAEAMGRVKDTVIAKLGRKRQMESGLKKALLIQLSLDANECRLKMSREKVKVFLERVREEEEGQKALVGEMTESRHHRDYWVPSKIRRVRSELVDINDIKNAAGKTEEDPEDGMRYDPEKSCPICFEIPKTVFSCSACHNFICGDCKERKEVLRCPSCRVFFAKTPLVRNVLAERLLNK